MQRDPTRRTDAARVATGSSMVQSPSVRVFWLGTTWTEGLIGRPPGLAAALTPAAAPGAFPALPGPDIVEPAAAAATAPVAFAEAAGISAFDAEFDAETEDCFVLFVEVKGEDL